MRTQNDGIPLEAVANYGPARPIAIARWLYVMAALVVAMVLVGGITRLTESGLSITEWKPITGALPPLSEAAWQAEFDAYRQIPEYTQVNGPAGMTLAEYKFIYFWEWAHRLLGRLIGVAFVMPLIYFWMRDAIPIGFKPRLLALLALGGLQGVFGWLMVSSGVGAEAQAAQVPGRARTARSSGSTIERPRVRFRNICRCLEFHTSFVGCVSTVCLRVSYA